MPGQNKADARVCPGLATPLYPRDKFYVAIDDIHETDSM